MGDTADLADDLSQPTRGAYQPIVVDAQSLLNRNRHGVSQSGDATPAIRGSQSSLHPKDTQLV